MFFDIHAHIRRQKGFPRLWGGTYPSLEELLALHDSIGVDRGVILPMVSPECSTVPQSIEDILILAEQSKGRLVPFCNVDPRALTNSNDAPLEKMFFYYKELGCKGIGEVSANLDFRDPKMQNLFRAAELAELPLTFHLSPFVGYSYGIVDSAGLPGLEASLQRFPKLKFFGHSQTFWAEMSEKPTIIDRMGYPKGKVIEGRVPQLMRKYPNLYGDLSAGSGFFALNRDHEYTIKFLNEFQDRLMYGTDIASPDPAGIDPLHTLLLSFLKDGAISQTVFNKIAFQNAIDTLKL